MTKPPESKLIDGGPRERAQIFRNALENGRSVSVGYRKGGKLEVRDLTGLDLIFIYSVPVVAYA